MAEHTIPTPPVGVHQWLLRREFEGEFFRLFFKFNLRDGFWHVDFASDSNIAQVFGIKMNLGVNKLAQYKTYLALPQGVLSVVDSTSTGTEPILQTFGTIVNLKYTDTEE